MAKNRLMVMAGGTGGHVFPALAVAKFLIDKGTHVTWLGTHKGIEAKVIPENNIDIEWISIEGLRGKGLLNWILAPINLLRATIQSFNAIRRVQPDCVLGMGGFVAGPGGLASRLLGKPLIIHEQNSVAGLTNKYLAKISTRILTGFENVRGLSNKAQWVGNPVRAEITSKSTNEDDSTVNVLVIGGSQGAFSFNHKLAEVFSKQTKTISVWHQSGKGNSTQVTQYYAGLGVEVKVTEFIENMATAYQWADLLICRAGAMTIAECCAASKPALLIPFPFSAGDHQIHNAKAMVAVGAAKLLSNDQLGDPEMCEALSTLLEDKEVLKRMGSNANALHKPNALQSVVEVCEEYLHA